MSSLINYHKMHIHVKPLMSLHNKDVYLLMSHGGLHKSCYKDFVIYLMVKNEKNPIFSGGSSTNHTGFSYTVLGGRKIAQSLASLSIKRAARVCSQLDPLVTERWNSITVLLTCFHQCQRLVKKRWSMCYYVCVIMHVKDP